ncbi:MAG TPA: dihydrolipoamide acetyltransferase family protein [Anaerolineaceae bacterium]|nr:dihydrolipoamide acetyltransferase family protein [Anaerolineaceae bacterium]
MPYEGSTKGVREEPAPAPTDGSGAGVVRASPLARRLAEEKGLDLKQVTGTGPGGRITRQDIENAATHGPAPVEAPAAAPSGPAQPAAQPAPQPQAQPRAWAPVGQIPADETVPLGRLRQAIGRRMSESRQTVPHFYVTSEYDVQALLELRKQINAQMPEGQKLTVNDFIVKAVALTLRQFPNLNASLKDGQLVRHGHVNVGIAVSVPGGLMTVVSRDTDLKSMSAISGEIQTMVERARSGKVRTEDIEGSTFSVSNLGMYGIEDFVAIINPPEAAILAVGGAKQVPVVVDGEVKVSTRMKATLSADHRITDGAEGAQFMQALGQFLENPMRLLV